MGATQARQGDKVSSGGKTTDAGQPTGEYWITELKTNQPQRALKVQAPSNWGPIHAVTALTMDAKRRMPMVRGDINVQFSHINGTHGMPTSPKQAGHPFVALIQAQSKLAEMNMESLPTLRLTRKRARFTLAVRMRGQ